MKYSLDIDINVPRLKVIELLDNPDNMKHWQEGFISFEHIDGTPGEEGAKSLLTYKMGKRTFEMTETVLKRNFPDEFSGTYEAKGVWNEVKNYFHEIEPTKTKWTLESDFQFKGFMKLVAFFMPGTFKKQSFKYMEAFKKFAENSQ